MGSTATTSSAPAAMGDLGQRLHLFQAAEEIGMLHQHAGRLVVDGRLQRRRRDAAAGVPTVTSSTSRLARYVARIWRYSGCTLAAVTTRARPAAWRAWPSARPRPRRCRRRRGWNWRRPCRSIA